MNFTNVIGIRKGKNFGTESDRIIGVCAHYDTVIITKGVDDNGSGVAAMLEVARQLDAMHADNENTVIFLAPDLEEYGLQGSEHFVAGWIPRWLDNYYRNSSSNLTPYGVIVLDSVMNYDNTSRSQSYESDQMSYIFPETFKSMASDDYEGGFIALIFRNLSDADLAQGFKDAWIQDGRKMFEIEEFPLPIETKYDPLWSQFRQIFWSDHYNFWTDTIPAIFLSDTANFRGDMIQCYHNPCDKLEVMLTDENVAFLGKTADAIVSTIVRMSRVSSGGTSVTADWSRVIEAQIIG